MRLRYFAELDKTWHEDDSGIGQNPWDAGTSTMIKLQNDLARSDNFDRLLEVTVWSIVGMIILSLASLLVVLSH